MAHLDKSSAKVPVAVAVDPYYVEASTPVEAPPTSAAAEQLFGPTPTPAPSMEILPQRRNWFHRGLINTGCTIGLAFHHAYLMLFSIAAFVIIVTLVSVGIGLLPLACVGVAVLYFLWLFMEPIARVDEWLYRQRHKLYSHIHANMHHRE
ncbi:hypothetical protein AeNC1_002953 [Aphanomyces euteiches]|nr:hypothetical protein AeNC1_002953 [Aphanomyces euteiches]